MPAFPYSRPTPILYTRPYGDGVASTPVDCCLPWMLADAENAIVEGVTLAQASSRVIASTQQGRRRRSSRQSTHTDRFWYTLLVSTTASFSLVLIRSLLPPDTMGSIAPSWFWFCLLLLVLFALPLLFSRTRPFTIFTGPRRHTISSVLQLETGEILIERITQRPA